MVLAEMNSGIVAMLLAGGSTEGAWSIKNLEFVH